MTTNNPTIQEKLMKVLNYLNSGHPEKALRLLDHDTHTPELANAKGVCLLRLNKIDSAMDVFKEIVFQHFICMPLTTPAIYKANYITTLLMKGFLTTALEIEKTLDSSSHPYVAGLKQAVKNWKQSLPWYWRILSPIKCYPKKPLLLPFAPGGI